MVEKIDIVDENDNIIGVGTRTEKEKKEFISRNVVVALRDKKGNYVLTTRGLNQKTFPGCYQFTACGLVRSGEDYSGAARRELREELGITCKLSFVTKKYCELEFDGITYRYFKGFFIGTYNKEDFSPNNEVQSIIKISFSELNAMVRSKDKLLPNYFIEEYDIIKSSIQGKLV